MRELTLGMSGPDVRRWHRFLLRERHLAALPGDTFVAATETGTAGLQKALGLPETGRADAETLAAALRRGLLGADLDEAGTSATPSAPAPRANWALGLPALGAAIAAIWAFWTSIQLENLKFEGSLIQQAMAVRANQNESEARVEAGRRLDWYRRLGLVTRLTETAIWDDLGTLPISRAPVQIAAAPPVPDVRPAPPPQTASPVSFPQRVFVQFAGSLRREDVQRMMLDLSSRWRVQGADGGGERRGSAARVNEVRYGSAAEHAAAVLLATDVTAARVAGGPVRAAATPNPQIPAGQLEVWISN